MTLNTLPTGEKGNECRHNPPASGADLRLDTYRNVHGPSMYDFLGGPRKQHPGCVVSYGDWGKLFARELGGYLALQGQKNVIYAKLSLDDETLGPLNDDPLVMADLRGRKIILTSDCLTREERAMVDKRLGELRNEFGFGEVAYALEKE